MKNGARNGGISRRSWLMAGLTLPLFSARAADLLNVRYDGDTIRVAPVNAHFLIGKQLERLKDGAAVAFVAQLDLLNEQRVLVRRLNAHFVVSYALWEERFSIAQLGKNPRSVDGLSAPAAEAWCFEGLTMGMLGIPTDRYFLLKLDVRTGGARDIEGETPAGISIRDLIGMLGQRKQEEWRMPT